ncbi:RHS repeat domain-containing protein [Solitalea canadensis]|uniref:RHS repeat domain-containing protein n=1 Tax=Solitalea canadensis TaxID=995 RepID=UPI001FE06C86|nr:RHS repeat-associated core domain-containing protein [Solitalea canadensis]
MSEVFVARLSTVNKPRVCDPVISDKSNLSDHLGNALVSVDKDPSTGAARVIQEDEYYAFGLRKGITSSSGNRYLYNGKELQESLGQYDYGARFYDPTLGRWNVPDPLAELSFSLTPYRYCYNNPIGFIDPFGLWEETAGGYTTKDRKDIERFMLYIETEKTILKNDPTTSQMDDFIKDEMSTNGRGKLSNGSTLLSEVKMIGYTNKETGYTRWYKDQESFSNMRHEVQGSLTPEALDPRTLGHNILWTSYAGGNNPKKYNGDDDFSYIPANPIELSAIKHDLAYDRLQIKGSGGLFNDKRAIPADWTFVLENLLHSINIGIDPINRFRAGVVGVGLGLGALPKTIEYYMPVMVSPPIKL